ncbi:hypothetical protein PMI04_016745 [Sphingobium sp. AP49]|nr:hypothetical protein [Sphingobium sp. AP49]WHO38191.1 hypothetical protein PMI04_016745 [Sphingobium sp. AP49]
MPQDIVPLAIDDIADMDDGASLFSLEDGDVLDISLMDVVIAIITRPS